MTIEGSWGEINFYFFNPETVFGSYKNGKENILLFVTARGEFREGLTLFFDGFLNQTFLACIWGLK